MLRGGVYLPPHRVARLESELAGGSEAFGKEHQQLRWELSRKRINGCVNKVNVGNVAKVAVELMNGVNLIRCRGLLVRALMKAQSTSPSYTHVFAALVAVLNSRLPVVGELLITRLVHQFRRSYSRSDRINLTSTLSFCAQLVNQHVLDDGFAIDLVATFLHEPTNDSIQLCCRFLTEVGMHFEEEFSKALRVMSRKLRGVLSEGLVAEHSQFAIEKFFAAQKRGFTEWPSVLPELDLVPVDDQVTHEADLLNEDRDRQEMLDIFQPVEPEVYIEENEKWRGIVEAVLSDEADYREDQGGVVAPAEPDDNPDAPVADIDDAALAELDAQQQSTRIIDKTDQDLISLRKTIYLCIMSSLNFEEAVHKLLSMKLRPGDEREVCSMLVDCCSMDRTFNRSFAMQAQRLCEIDERYAHVFAESFGLNYGIIHRYETNNLRNVAMFYAHLIAAEAIPWEVLACVRLTEQDTTAASRIFLKVLLQQLVDSLGLQGVLSAFRAHSELCAHSILLRDSPTHMRFCVNFFTAIGLPVLSDDLRAELGVRP